jgi:hypothetical protein
VTHEWSTPQQQQQACQQLWLGVVLRSVYMQLVCTPMMLPPAMHDFAAVYRSSCVDCNLLFQSELLPQIQPHASIHMGGCSLLSSLLCLLLLLLPSVLVLAHRLCSTSARCGVCPPARWSCAGTQPRMTSRVGMQQVGGWAGSGGACPPGKDTAGLATRFSGQQG